MKWAKIEVSTTLSHTDYRLISALQNLKERLVKIILDHRIYSKRLICAILKIFLTHPKYGVIN